MKNLKRALSFALASVMLVGMMVVGASAAEFGDADKIAHTDAVNTLVALGILKGKDTGNFDPEGIITRAEMAKMICVALNGGKDPNLDTTAGTYKDTANHWASGYIDYCTNLGIVSGDTAGNFNPDKTVTGTEAAKMILIALGYDAKNEKFVNNASWATNINVRASQKSLYEDVAVNPSEGLTRDSAAQMLFNGVQAVMVEYSYQVGAENGNVTSIAIAKDAPQTSGKDTTILPKRFSLENEKGYMTEVTYDKDDKEYTYTIQKKITDNKADDLIVSFDSKEDFTSFYGTKVKVLYKEDSLGVATAYGMYSASKDVIVTTKAEITDGTAGKDTIKVAGTKYTLGQNYEATPVFVAPDAAEFDDGDDDFLDNMMGDATVAPASTVILVADANTKIAYAVVIPSTVKKVTFVGKDSITAGSTYKFEDDVIAEGIAKDDYVNIVLSANAFTNQNTVTKLDTVSGTVDATRTNETKLDGIWYKNVSGMSALDLGSTYDAYVLGTYIYAAKKTSDDATMKDVVMVSDAQAVKFGVSEAKMYFSDGSNQIVNISKLGGEDVTEKVSDGLYTYKLKSGKYEITAVSNSNKAGADGYNGSAGNYVQDTKKLGDYYIANDAVIYVKNTNTSTDTTTYKFFTGEQAKKWIDTDTATAEVLYTTVNGLKTAQAVYITLSGDTSGMPSASGDTAYGYVTSKPETVKEGDDTYFSYTVWTEDGSRDILDESSSLNAAKGDVISFTDLGSNHIDTVVALTTSAVAAITGVNGKDLAVRLPAGGASEVAKTDDDTVILYVNTSDAAGVEGGELAPATEQANGSYITNAWIVADGSDETLAAVIVYDVNNDIDNFDNDATNGSAGYAITAATYASDYEGWTIATDKTKACEGDVVTVTLTSDGTGAQNQAAIAVTGTGASVSSPVELTASTAKTYTVEVTVGTAAISVITVTLGNK